MLAALLALAAPADRAAASSERRPLAEEEAPGFRAVGRLNIAGSRFCTAALVSDRLVMTAAHCLFDPRTRKRLALSSMRFVAGLHHGAHAGSRRVARAAVLPGYVFDGRASLDRIGGDVALLELDRPIPELASQAFDVLPGAWRSGSMTIVSYAKDSAHAPSIQSKCAVRTKVRRVVALDCEAIHGASGSPILVEDQGRLAIVGVVSAMGRPRGGSPTALAVEAAPFLTTLAAELRGDPAAPALTARRAGSAASGAFAVSAPR